MKFKIFCISILLISFGLTAENTIFLRLDFDGKITSSFQTPEYKFKRESVAFNEEGKFFNIDEPVFEKGLTGKGIYLGSEVKNLFSPEQSEGILQNNNFVPAGNALIQQSREGWGYSKNSIKVITKNSIFDGVAIPVIIEEQIQTPEYYIVSLYIKGKGNVRIFVKEIKHQIISPPLRIKLKKEWERVYINLVVTKKARKFSLECLNDNIKTPAIFQIDGLQLEKATNITNIWPKPWTKGGTTRKRDLLKIKIPSDFPTKEGSILFWFKTSWPAIPEEGFKTHWFIYDRELKLYFWANNPMTYLGKTEKGRDALVGLDWTQAKKRRWQANTWHQWAGIWKNGNIYCYLDGKLVNSSTDKNISISINNNRWITLGGTENYEKGIFDCADSVIDEFRIYNKALNKKDIEIDYKNLLSKCNNIPQILEKKLPETKPTKEMVERYKIWRKRKLDINFDAWATLLPAEPDMMKIPLGGKIAKEYPYSGRSKAATFETELTKNAGRFYNLPAWHFYSERTSWGDMQSYISGVSKLIDTPEKFITCSVWFATHDIYQNGTIYAQGGNVEGFNLSLNNGKVYLNFTKNKKSYSLNTPLPDTCVEKWTNIVFVFNGEKKIASIYINGEKKVSRSIPLDKIPVGHLPWRVGRAMSYLSGINGLLDELIFWKKELSDFQIKDMYVKGKPDREPDVKILSSHLKDTVPVIDTCKVFINNVKNQFVLPINEIYIYSSFNKTPQPEITDFKYSSLMKAKYIKVDTKNQKLIDYSNIKLKSIGKFGNGINIYKGENGINDTLSYPAIDWPVKEGTISFWFKPSWSLNKKEYHWLWYGGWVSFMGRQEGERIISYAGRKRNDKPAAIVTPWKNGPEIHKDKWYLYTVTWDKKGKTSMYINGIKYGETEAPRREKPLGLFIGSESIAREIYGARRGLKSGGFLDGTVDELLLLKRALRQNEIKKLYELNNEISSVIYGVEISTIRTAFRTDEEINLPVKAFGGDRIDIKLHNNRKTLIEKKLSIKNNTINFRIPPHSILPGNYKLEIHLFKGDKEIAEFSRNLVINPVKKEEIEFGMYGVNKNLESEEFSKAAKEAKWKWIVSGSSDPLVIDRLFRNGCYILPHIGIDYTGNLKRKGIPVEKWGQKSLYTGKWISAMSFYSPVAREEMKKTVKNAILNAGNTPALEMLSLWDEITQREDVSPYAIEIFKKLTGLKNPPEFKAVKSGSIVDDNNPLALWIDIFGGGMGWWQGPGIAMMAKDITNYARRLKSGIKTCAMPSCDYNGCTDMVVEVYPYLIESPLASVWGKSELEADYSIDYYFSSVPERSKYPLFILPGWLHYPGTPLANPSLKVMMEIAIAKGAKGIIVAPASWYFVRDDMRKDYLKFIKFCRKYGKEIKNANREGINKVAWLFNMHNVMDYGKGWRIFSANYENFYYVLRLAGIQPEIIREKDVKERKLKNYEVLICTQNNVLTKGVYDEIVKFIKNGGTVFVRNGKNTVEIPGAIKLPEYLTEKPYISRFITDHPRNTTNFAFYVPLVRNLIMPYMKQNKIFVDSPFFAWYIARYKNKEYLFLINTDIYRDRTTTVIIKKFGIKIHELTENKNVRISKNGENSGFVVNVKAGEWKVYEIE